MWPNLLEDPDAAFALWELAMAQQHATEDRLEQARRDRDARSIQILTWELDELRYRADLLLANAVQARRDSAPPEVPAALRRALRAEAAAKIETIEAIEAIEMQRAPHATGSDMPAAPSASAFQ